MVSTTISKENNHKLVERENVPCNNRTTCPYNLLNYLAENFLRWEMWEQLQANNISNGIVTCQRQTVISLLVTISNYFVNKWNPDCSNYICTTIMVYMEVMMWAIKRELTLVEIDTGKSPLQRAKLRHFVVPFLVLVTSCVDKEVVPNWNWGPFSQ